LFSSLFSVLSSLFFLLSSLFSRIIMLHRVSCLGYLRRWWRAARRHQRGFSRTHQRRHPNEGVRVCVFCWLRRKVNTRASRAHRAPLLHCFANQPVRILLAAPLCWILITWSHRLRDRRCTWPSTRRVQRSGVCFVLMSPCEIGAY
jgi:hypothetical protein